MGPLVMQRVLRILQQHHHPTPSSGNAQRPLGQADLEELIHQEVMQHLRRICRQNHPEMQGHRRRGGGGRSGGRSRRKRRRWPIWRPPLTEEEVPRDARTPSTEEEEEVPRDVRPPSTEKKR